MEPQTNGRVYADLVSGLLDARIDPATGRFDDELDAAVSAGEMSAEVARRLKFWQRASLRALTAHTRTVLPTALDALDTSRRDAQAYVDQLSGALAEEEGGRGEEEVSTATIDLGGSRPRLLVAGLVTTAEHD